MFREETLAVKSILNFLLTNFGIYYFHILGSTGSLSVVNYFVGVLGSDYFSEASSFIIDVHTWGTPCIY